MYKNKTKIKFVGYMGNISNLSEEKFYIGSNGCLDESSYYIDGVYDANLMYNGRLQGKRKYYKAFIVSLTNFVDYLKQAEMDRAYNYAMNKIKKYSQYYYILWEVPEDMYRYFELMNTLNGDIFDKLRKIINKEDNYIKWRHFKGMK